MAQARDRDAAGRPRNARPRDALGRPLARGALGEPEPPPVHRNADEALDEAQRLLDAGRPFTAHEVLEEAWKASPAGERELWRGLAQLAVGLTHAARGKPAGAARLLARGATNLAGFLEQPGDAGPEPHGMPVASIIDWAGAAARQLSLDPAGPIRPLQLRPPR